MVDEPTKPETVITVEEVRVLLGEVARLREENARLRGAGDDWRQPMVAAVDDQLMRDIVMDHRTSVHLPSVNSPHAVVRVGYAQPAPLGPPPGSRYVDRIVDAFSQREKLDAIAKESERPDMLVKAKLARDALSRPEPAEPAPFRRRV
jgi:hypothetical protein